MDATTYIITHDLIGDSAPATEDQIQEVVSEWGDGDWTYAVKANGSELRVYATRHDGSEVSNPGRDWRETGDEDQFYIVAGEAGEAEEDADSLNEQHVILVGRHTAVLPAEVQVVEQQNITWALTRQECQEQLGVLIAQAREIKCGILFQNIPGMLACAIASQGTVDVPMGVIISVPGARAANVVQAWALPAAVYADGSGMGAAEVRQIVEEVVAHANGRAKFATSAAGEPDGFTVTVDPVTEFQFSHIEWLWE